MTHEPHVRFETTSDTPLVTVINGCTCGKELNRTEVDARASDSERRMVALAASDAEAFQAHIKEVGDG